MAQKASTRPTDGLEGRKAPVFTLEGDDGRRHALREYAGRWVVLYFYPKAMTSGCTVEARDFTERLADFEAAGAKVLGVSPDPVDRLARFRDKEKLAHVLLSDPEHKVAEKYGVWQEKRLYGRTFMGIVRTTLLIGPDGRVVAHWPKVKVKGHADEVLDRIRTAAGSDT